MPDLASILDLERIELNLFRATHVFAEDFALYGGQVAAQALLAAGHTVEQQRRPHSLHGYFLRPGEPLRPTVFEVFRDRDGRSFSARRVVAIQEGAVIFNMSASFHVGADGPGSQVGTMPDVPPPDACAAYDMLRLVGFETRLPPQPYEQARWPTRFWARASDALPGDPLVQACALTYLSDISTGVLPDPDGAALPGSSLDHAVWFHEVADVGEWTLSDYHPQMSGHGRGWYTGSIFAPDGTIVASTAQECLFR